MLHTYVRGDRRKGQEEIEVGSLGADLTRDQAAGGYRIARLYHADPDFPAEASPLQAPGVGLVEGDLIEAVNGVATLSVADPALLLRNQAGRQVLLRVKHQGGGEARDVIAVPVPARDAANLRYTDWELSRRRRVEEAGKGRIGYLHLRAMNRDNYTEWARDFYPVQPRGPHHRRAPQRGGNIDSWIPGKLLRKAWFYWKPRVGTAP